MKKSLLLSALFALLLSSCIVIEDEVYYGPDGRDGKVFFGIDYDYQAPYSYWDDNSSVPENPFFGEYYRTWPGIYNFEYYVSPWEYWYGTYEVWENPGTAGQPNGVAGLDGADNYLLLICNPDGFYFENWEDCSCSPRSFADGTQVIEADKGNFHFRVSMKKTTIQERPSTHPAKLKSS